MTAPLTTAGKARTLALAGSTLLMMSCALAQEPPLPGPRPAGAPDVREGFTVIDSVAALREAMTRSDQRIRMKPGVYRVRDAWPDDPKAVFLCTGSNNHFDLRGVTLEIDTQVLASMPRTPAHQLGVYRVQGSNIMFEGATFADIGDHPPRRSLSEFTVSGDDVVFRDCRFIIRGSSPYGYGDLYGKGAGAAVWLQKHAAMGILGDRCIVERCSFRIHTFGHAIHLHGAQDTIIRDVSIEGDLRRSDELYAEETGPAKDHDYKVMFPPWSKGRPIPRNTMLSLTEDGIRAYVYGNDRDGNRRRTGQVTVERCVVKRMRGGITLCMARSGTISDSTVIDSGYPGHAYSVPSDGVVRNCRGNAAYAPLLSIPYKQTRHADIELTLIPATESLGNHPLARIVGDDGHRIVITMANDTSPDTLRPIVIGSVGERYTSANTPEEDVRKHLASRKILLENQTPHPVELTAYAQNCRITTRGPVRDHGTGTVIVKPSQSKQP